MALLNLSPGRVVAERLRFDQRLGEGAIGDVWRARHLELAADVAVKIMAPGPIPVHGGAGRACGSAERAMTHFLGEAELSQRVESPHVVRMIECGLLPEIGPYIVMEFLDGLDLSEYVARFGALSVSQMATVVAHICAGIEALHGADVFHRDVKPDNVILHQRRSGARTCATLIDLGIALDGRAPPESVRPDVLGTPAYMSPERLMGTGSSAAQSDLWSVAIIAYQCLLGRLPFDDTTLGTLCVAMHRGTFILPRSVRTDVPRKLDGWFSRALHRTASERFASARDMREALIDACSPFDLDVSDEAPGETAATATMSGVHPRFPDDDAGRRQAC